MKPPERAPERQVDSSSHQDSEINMKTKPARDTCHQQKTAHNLLMLLLGSKLQNGVQCTTCCVSGPLRAAPNFAARLKGKYTEMACDSSHMVDVLFGELCFSIAGHSIWELPASKGLKQGRVLPEAILGTLRPSSSCCPSRQLIWLKLTSEPLAPVTVMRERQLWGKGLI